MKSIVYPSTSTVKDDVLGIPTFPRVPDGPGICIGSQDQRKGSQSGGPGLIRVGRSRNWQGAKSKEQHKKQETSGRPNTRKLSSRFSGLFRKFHGSLIKHLFPATKKPTSSVLGYILCNCNKLALHFRLLILGKNSNF